MKDKKKAWTPHVRALCHRFVAWRGLVLLFFAGWMYYMCFFSNKVFSSSSAVRVGSFDLPSDGSSKKTQTHLIIVACHAVLRVQLLDSAMHSDEAWYLFDYQKDQGFPQIITSHILKGFDLLHDDVESMLIFSGGETREDTGPLSEAASYYYAATKMHRSVFELHHRVFLEEYARDSFENLLFSVCRFKEVTGSYPLHITVVGFDFKEKRFSDLHRRAIGFPADNFKYIGIKPDAPFIYERAVTGEGITATAFESDMYGCSRALTDKKHSRDPYHRTIPYELSCRELRPLLHWCGPGLYSFTKLPWSQTLRGHAHISNPRARYY
jgi:hypothetical protein